MKHCIAAPLLTLLFVSLAFSQTNANRGLVLTGTVIDVKSKFDFEHFRDNQNLEALKKAMDGGRHYIFEVKVYLQFRNETDTPQIIFLPSQFYGQSTIAFEGPSGSDKVRSQIFRKDGYGFRDYDVSPIIFRELAEAEPKKNRFVIIEPRGYFESHETLRVNEGYKFDLKAGKKPWKAQIIPEYPAFKIEYFLSLRDRKEAADALDAARRRWKKFGEFSLDSNGDYSIRSAKILNKPAE